MEFSAVLLCVKWDIGKELFRFNIFEIFKSNDTHHLNYVNILQYTMTEKFGFEKLILDATRWTFLRSQARSDMSS